MSARAAHNRRGFTLIELLVVMILLGVAAGLIVARFRANDVRRAEARAESVATLFEAAARRQALSGRGSMVEYTAEDAAFTMYNRRTDVGRYAFQRTTEWRKDRLARPVSLEGMTLAEATINGNSPTDDDAWRVVFDPAGVRPDVRLVLSPEGGQASGTRWLVHVPRTGTEIGVVLLGRGETARAHRAAFGMVDLDGIGYGDTPW